jgi:hypothetical protein
MPLDGFQYSPLNRESNEIRLITLKSGDVKEDIQCLLTQHSLNQAPAYEALSYAWGNSTEVMPISINGCMVHIRSNLYSALRHLRCQKNIRILWVDAVCIDQNDNTEKDHQVMIMKRIYECANQVIIWLDEATRGSGLALEKIKEAANFRKEELVSKTLQWARDEIFGTEAWIEFLNFFHREWWTRTWVIQEVAVAKHIVLVCGDDHILVDCFDKTITNLRCMRLTSTRREGFADADEDCNDIKGIKELERTTYDLLYLAGKYRYLKSSDPRDKLYALFGLAGEINFKPDYGVSVREVYRRFVEACIERSGTLDVLNFVSWSDRGDITLPSWIPDWSFPGLWPLIKYESWDQDPFFCASGDSVSEFQTLFSLAKAGHIYEVDDGPASMFCSMAGFVTDTIVHLGDLAADAQSIRSPKTPLMQQWISLFEAHTDLSGPYKTEEDHYNAFWMTLIADSNYDRRTSRDPKLYQPFFGRWRDYRGSRYSDKP